MFNFQETKTKLADTKTWLAEQYQQLSTGRANPQILDSILVPSYGATQPIKAVASIHNEDARTLRITPWQSDTISAIETAIRDSQLPFSVSVDDAGLRVVVPALTEESRKQLVRAAKQKLEEARVTIRNERHRTEKIIEQQLADNTLTKDDAFRLKKELQDMVDTANKELEDTYKAKESDTMQV